MGNQSRYIVKSVVHATSVLSAFRDSGEILRLRDVAQRTGFTKGTCFRLLYTLHHCGFLEKVGENQYRLVSSLRPHRRYYIGYAALGQDSSFVDEVREGLVRAAELQDVELLVVDNRYQAKIALRNAEYLIHEEVDLAIEFQTDEAAASAIASKYLEAGIPVVAVDIPHPGATYFGANNYEAGLMAGRHLGRWAKKQWDGADEILLLEVARAGSLVRARVRGILSGLKEGFKEAESCPVISIDGDGQFGLSFDKVRQYLRESKASRVLVGAVNDPSALGTIRAFEEAGRTSSCAIVSQNAEPDARAELRRPTTPLIASVGYFPEKYGRGLIRLALDILAKKAVPPAVFVQHQLVTPDNVDHLYPNDVLLGTRTG